MHYYGNNECAKLTRSEAGEEKNDAVANTRKPIIPKRRTFSIILIQYNDNSITTVHGLPR